MAVLQLIFTATDDGMAKALGLLALYGAQGELCLWLIVREKVGGWKISERIENI